MRISTFRKAGLGSCMLLALLSGMPLSISKANASSGIPGMPSVPNVGTAGVPNILPPQVTQNVVTMASSAVSQVTSGGARQIPAVASFLNNNSLKPSAQNLSSLTSTLNNIIKNPGMAATAATGLVGGLMSGTVSGAQANLLSKIPGAGNLDLNSLLSTMGSSGIKSLINSLPIAAQGGALQTAMGVLGSPQALQAMGLPAGAGAAAQAITQNFPGISGALGGLTSGITSQVQQWATQLLGAGAGAVVGALVGGALSGLAGGALSTLTGGLGGGGAAVCGTCCGACGTKIPEHYEDVRTHVTSEFIKHQQWFITTYWLDNILPALMLMAEQLTVAGMLQIEMFGTLLDAKHQLETQRLLQQLQARAHKDYQPSEGMCTFGTTVRSLAASERKSNATQMAFAQRLSQRETLSGDVLSKESVDSDLRSRFRKYKENYCDQADNANGLKTLCPTSAPAPRRNIDVDFTRNIESRLTLDMDLAPITGAATITPDTEDVFALSANLFSHTVPPHFQPDLLARLDRKVRISAASKYMDMRAILAKRSVAENSFAAITSMRASGDESSAPYTKRLLYELGVTDTAEIEKILGKKPSYFAQMEVLTKKLYQNPVFYTELYDKPVNVERKTAAMQAIGLMQDRDLYNSLLRSEAVLSVLLETMLEREQEKVVNAGKKMGAYGGGQ